MKIAILCGGSGTRLWPLSRELMPKQFAKLLGESSLFTQTIARNLAFSDDFCIVTSQKHYFLAQDEVEKIGEVEKIEKIPESCPPKTANLAAKTYRYILEAAPKNTAAALAFVALEAKEDDIILALPSDHIIKGEDAYRAAVLEAQNLAKNGHIALFGIKPTAPHTGYGYIEEAGESLRFIEKPDAANAARFAANPNFYWNSGMFCFAAGTLISELETHRPKLLAACKKALSNAKREGGFLRLGAEDSEAIEEISIDYAVMERSRRLKLVKGAFAWNDVGSFDALKDEYAKDADQNATNAELIALDSHHNFIYTDKLAAAIGVENLVVIDTPDSLLISKMGQTQRVKDIVGILREKNSELCQLHRKAHRPWGSYTVLLETPSYKIKQIVVKPKQRLSLQKHFHRNEHWVVVRGSAVVTLEGREFFLKANESTYIPMGHTHRLENPGKIELVMIEVQVGEYLGEDDIVRLEDDYRR